MIEIDKKDLTLVAGPWVGEFGWELCCWQGYIRRLSKHYKKTIVLSRPGHEFLYQDFADEYIPFDSPSSASDEASGDIDNVKLNIILTNISKNTNNKAVHLAAFNIGFAASLSTTIVTNNRFNEQDFIKYKSDTMDKSFDIIIHPRNRIVGAERNWSKENWLELVKMLLICDYTIGTIGSAETFNIEGTEDLRNIAIEDSVSVINRTKLVLGPSSGPMHLASLCGTPRFLWDLPRNKYRHETQWNPFNTTTYFYSDDGWCPSIMCVYDMVRDILK